MENAGEVPRKVLANFGRPLRRSEVDRKSSQQQSEPLLSSFQSDYVMSQSEQNLYDRFFAMSFSRQSVIGLETRERR